MFRIGTLVTCEGEYCVFEIIEALQRRDKPTKYKLSCDVISYEVWDVTAEMIEPVKCENCKHFQEGEGFIKECLLKNVWVRPYDSCNRFRNKKWKK